MERPYVICHILSSLDGKITGPFMGTEAAGVLGAEYGRYRTEMNARALLYGTTTTKEFTGFRKPVLEKTEEVPEGDFVADDRADLYFVSVDVDGEIGWESGIFCNKGRAPAHVIEVLTASTPTAYKACLRKTGVSYIIAGEKELDCEAAMKKLYQFFHIEKLLICGGGIVNWSFLQAGMVDELSLFLAPVTDGGCGTASLFTQIQPFTEGEPVEFLLREIEQIGGGGATLELSAPKQKDIKMIGGEAMKVLLANGSPHKEGCTYTALCEVADTLNKEGIETEIFWIGNKPIGGCIACLKCGEKGCCVFDDAVNCFREKAYGADGFVFGSPVHYAGATGNMTAFMDRLFYSELRGNGNKAFYMKPAAAVVSARRAGTTVTFDQLNKYFTIQEMPVVSSRYWNMIHGANAEQARQDAEGLYTMRVLGRNMAYMLRCKEVARKVGVELPEQETPVFTNFIR